MPIHVPVEINFSFINQKIIFFLNTYVLLFNSCKVECCDVKQRDFETLVFKKKFKINSPLYPPGGGGSPS